MGHILSLMTFVPLIGALLILLLPKGRDGLVKWVALATATVPLLFALGIWNQFERGTSEIQFAERTSWINFTADFAGRQVPLNIEYYMGIDGLSVSMVLLTALLCVICMIASWGITKWVKAYFALFLLLETGMIGVFCALDFFLFYVFWEVMLLPMYFLIGIWGGPRKEYAAIKFFLYTLAGSVLMLLAGIAMYYLADGSFDLIHMSVVLPQNPEAVALGKVLFIALFIGFAIKIPLFPFHTWLPDAHVEAPTAVSVILAGVLLKMGAYGILRICYPIFPEATQWFAPALATLGVVNIIYGAMCAMAQKDFKKLVAYSSISHMGYVCLGMAALTPQAVSGAVMQMFNHGTITAMLFLLVGVVYDRVHHRDIERFGGLRLQTPVYAGVVMLAFFAALGLPGLSGFWGEAFVFLGALPTFKYLTITALLGIVLGAAYILWTYERVFLGPLNEKYKDLTDINARELVCLAPLAVLVIYLGVYPQPLLELLDATLVDLVRGIL